MLFRIKTIQVGQQEAGGVADAAIGISTALQNGFGHRHFAGIVRRRHPQAQDVGTQAVGYFLRRNHVAHGLGHLATLLVHGKTVRQQAPVRRMTVDGATRQQGRVEPATVLIGAFQVEVGTRALLVALRVRTPQHMAVGGTGVKPHIQGVGNFFVIGGFVAQQLGRLQLEPGFDALLFDTLRHLLNQLDGTGMQLARDFMQEKRQRHAPVALTGNTPVRATGNHVVQTCLTPGRSKYGLFDGV